jgi:hypothetical protein
MADFNVVANTATKCLDSWSNIDKVRFHYFNPNGIMAKRRVSDDKVRAMVDSGFAKSGALLAYGSLNNYHTEKLTNLILQKQRVTDFEANYYVEQIEKEIANAEAFIDSIAATI